MSALNSEFNWKRQPEAEAFVKAFLDEAVSKSAFLKVFEQELKEETSTPLFALVDHIGIGVSQERLHLLEAVGFKKLITRQNYQIFRHPGAQLPDVILMNYLRGIQIGIIVDSIASFLQVHGINRNIEGTSFSPFRRANIGAENSIEVFVVERRGSKDIEPIYERCGELQIYWNARELWMTRSRQSEEEENALTEAEFLANEFVDELGEDQAACLILMCEREYWQLKNLAGQLQNNRQNRMGIGWANHDHHTFRSSRKNFRRLVKFFEILGFYCRERFYAGEEAGWGAQIMENPNAKLVLFLDVDLDAKEIEIDFAHEELRERKTLGTIGLWCGLHGDSILEAGMHHLEAQFEFDQLKEDFAKLGVGMMQPFSDFSYLKQAFTEGEQWEVSPKRIERLLYEEKITPEQAEHFKKNGAIGSHLENLQRREGYKGFNQKNVSLIIKETDPRKFRPNGTVSDQYNS